MERCRIVPEQHLAGYDSLRRSLGRMGITPLSEISFTPNQAYDTYHKIPKVFVQTDEVPELVEISDALRNESLPRYLEAAGWAAAEAALVGYDMEAAKRHELLRDAEDAWERALTAQQNINESEAHQWLREASAPFRMALDLAHLPLMKALVAGDITPATIERVFVDTLMVAQAADVQLHLARQANDHEESADLLGFGHECTALLTLLYLNDPRYVPIPSSTRAGAGYDYPNQTHDISVINQHFGDILKVIPVEVKSKASLHDLRRYDALIVRGKMHLSLPGMYLPQHTHEAFAAAYEGNATKIQRATVANATNVFCDLLKHYQKGERRTVDAPQTPTRFHERDVLARRFKEFDLDRAIK